jgi:Raf kinase inhibitor-like YbhB/YbcL family protein
MRIGIIPTIILTVAITLTITGGKAMALELKSNVFAEGKPIPSKYTCEGSDISPPLSWSGAPSGTKSFALIADDPDAPMGTWVHWVTWDIPATATAFPEGGVASGTKQGMTDFKRPGYGGPCPPSGTHRYFFKLYALDTALELSATAGKGELEKAMKGHILAQTQLMGTYAKQR